jgi:transposase
MWIIGVDYHPSMQDVVCVDTETGEYLEQTLHHSTGQAEKFYRDLKQKGATVRVGIEATGHARWFERLIAKLGFELWIGDPSKIKAARVGRQKRDREDARLLHRLLVEERFPRLHLCSNPRRSPLRAQIPGSWRVRGWSRKYLRA